MKSFWVLVLLVFPLSLYAQLRLDLEECIRQAVEADRRLKNDRLESRVQRNDYVAAIGEVMPEVTAETRFGKRMGRAVDPGTNLFATQDFVEGNLSLEISVPLFEGFTRINKIIFQRVNKEIGMWTVSYRENEVAFRAMEAFYRVLFQEQLLSLATEQRRLSGRYLQQTEEFVKEGLKATADLLEMKARARADVYRETVRRNAYRMALLELKQLLWLEPADSVQIVLPEPQRLIPVSLPAREVYNQSVNFLPQFRLMELRLKASKKKWAIAAGKFSPALRGEIGIYSGYYDTERDKAGNKVGWKMQLDNHLNQYFGLTFSLPILKGFRNTTGVRIARLQWEQEQNRAEMERQNLYAEIENACLSLQAAIDESRCAGETLGSEELALRQAEEKWKEGLIPVFELMEARNRYFMARAEVVRTQLQYGIKRKTVDFFQGEPLMKVKD